MKFANWFKVLWWLLLSGVLTAYLVERYSELVAGRAVPADVFVFLIWVAVLLVPIFQEVEFFGFRFRHEIQRAKEELRSEIHSVRAELRNAVDVRTTFSPQITLPPPPPDSQLPDLEARVKEAVRDVLMAQGIRGPAPAPADLRVPDDVTFLFDTRFGIERELRRLARERRLDINMQRVAGIQLLRALVQAGVLEVSLERGIRNVYSICSAAIHGEDVTPTQVSFVKDVGPQLIGALRAIRIEGL